MINIEEKTQDRLKAENTGGRGEGEKTYNRETSGSTSRRWSMNSAMNTQKSQNFRKRKEDLQKYSALAAKMTV